MNVLEDGWDSDERNVRNAGRRNVCGG